MRKHILGGFLRPLFFFLAIGLFVNTAAAGTRDPNTPDEKYTEFGKKFPTIVLLKALIVEDGVDLHQIQTLSLAPDKEEKLPKISYQIGSGVVIKPNWVLTAGHVVKGAALAVAKKDDKTEIVLEKILVHPDFTDNRFGVGDLALCYSPTDFDLEFYTPLYTDIDEVGKGITISGYGAHGTFHTGATQSDYSKRAGQNRIDADKGTILICTPSAQLDRMPLEFMIAQGDSGGGMFIGNKLAGINSFLMARDKKPDGTYTDESAFTRISLYAKWINEQIELHELAIAGKNTMAPDLSKIMPIVSGITP